MINKDNTAIIFGCSPFINEMKKKDVNYLIDNYYHLAINNFIHKYNNVKNIIFSDYSCYDWIRDYITNQKIIMAQSAHRHNFILEKKEAPNNVEYLYDARSEIFHDLSGNMLAMYKTTAHPAINYAYLKGYKNIILCGIDLTENWNHFYSNETTDNDIIRNRVRINKMRNLLYSFKEFVNLYTLNSNSDLEIDKINIKELIK